VGTIGVSVEIPVQFHRNESDALHAIAQLLTGINGVMEIEALRAAASDEEPFVANASPIVKNLVPLHHESTARQNGRYCGLKNFSQTFFAQHLDQTRTTRLQRREYVLQDGHVVLPVVE